MESCFALMILVRHPSAGQRASRHHIEQRMEVHSSLAGAVHSTNDTLAADRCGSVLSAKMIMVLCASVSLMFEVEDVKELMLPQNNVIVHNC